MILCGALSMGVDTGGRLDHGLHECFGGLGETENGQFCDSPNERRPGPEARRTPGATLIERGTQKLLGA